MPVVVGVSANKIPKRTELAANKGGPFAAALRTLAKNADGKDGESHRRLPLLQGRGGWTGNCAAAVQTRSNINQVMLTFLVSVSRKDHQLKVN